MLTICDTHVILFWADRPDRLSVSAQQYLDEGIAAGELACAAISLWEIAVLFRNLTRCIESIHTLSPIIFLLVKNNFVLCDNITAYEFIHGNSYVEE